MHSILLLLILITIFVALFRVEVDLPTVSTPTDADLEAREAASLRCQKRVIRDMKASDEMIVHGFVNLELDWRPGDPIPLGIQRYCDDRYPADYWSHVEVQPGEVSISSRLD